MATLTKAEIARRNGAKSKGPVSIDGKLRSSMNAMKHGLNSDKMFVLENETPDRWRELLDLCVRKFRPQDDLELELVTEIAFARWRMRRAWTAETALIDMEMDKQNGELKEKYRQFDEGVRIASAFKTLAGETQALPGMTRCESRHRRNFERALANLEKLRNEKMQNEPTPAEPRAEAA